MTVKFTKMHALGNDFLVLNGVQQHFEPNRDWIREVGDRHRGIGFDQLLHIKSSDESIADFALEIYNSDGELAKQCGNGTLCMARFVHEERLTSKHSIAFKTLGGLVEATLLKAEIEGGMKVKAELGVPTIDPSGVPFVSETTNLDYELNLGLASTPKIRLIPVGMGNPHAVLFKTSACADNLELIANALQTHQRFPDSVNVEFAEILDRSRIQIRVFERGAGETMACGTGACAAVAAARLAGHVDRSVSVNQAGGTALVDWEGPNHPISLTAPASRVFDGEIQLD